MRAQLKPMTDEDVLATSLPVLRKHFGPFGFETATVADEQDFDGDDILRMMAKVKRDVPARTLTEATGDVRNNLLSQGEERFVFLSATTGVPDIVDDEELG